MSALALERQVGSVVGAKYRLVRVIGRGGMGVVYEAEHSMTRRRVAVKVLHAHHKETGDAARRFINEAQAAGRVQHPNVVEVLDAGEDPDGSLYLVLELLSGQDLATQLLRKRRLEVDETVTVIAQVLQALVVAHAQKIIHRDIKPENIYLTRSVTGDSHVKILDFGISKAMGGSEHGPGLSVTQTNTTVGTPHYMSPEQARGERTIDTRADLWAVGVVMYECLAGKVPFDGETYNDQIVRVITEPHVPLSHFDVPAELSRIVDKALEKDRTRRYARAAEMLADLRHFVQRSPAYSSIPSQVLREPTSIPTPLPPAMSAPSQPTLDGRQELSTPSSDTMPSLGVSNGLASLYDSANEDLPTTVRTPEALGLGDRISGPVPTSAFSRFVADRHRLLITGGLLIGALGLGGAAALLSRNPSHPSTPVVPPVTLVTLHLTGAPPGAQILVAGQPASGGDLSFTRSQVPVAVDVVAQGYQPLHVRLVPDHDQTLPLALVPLAVAPPAPVVVAPAPAAIDTTVPPAVPHAAALAPVPARGVGYVSVHAQTGCAIFIDGASQGATPLARVALPPGTHRLICRTGTGALRSREIMIESGRAIDIAFDP